MVEDEKDGALVELDVDLPELLIVPHERIVDLDVQLELFNAEKLLEGQVGGALDRVEDAVDRGLVAVLLGEPRNAANKRRVGLAFESLERTRSRSKVVKLEKK